MQLCEYKFMRVPVQKSNIKHAETCKGNTRRRQTADRRRASESLRTRTEDRERIAPREHSTSYRIATRSSSSSSRLPSTGIKRAEQNIYNHIRNTEAFDLAFACKKFDIQNYRSRRVPMIRSHRRSTVSEN